MLRVLGSTNIITVCLAIYGTTLCQAGPVLENLVLGGTARESSTGHGSPESVITETGGLEHTHAGQNPLEDINGAHDIDPETVEGIVPNFCAPAPDPAGSSPEWAGILCPHFWEVTLGTPGEIEIINLYPRGGCCQDRLRDIVVTIFAGGAVAHQSALLNPENALDVAGAGVIAYDVVADAGAGVLGDRVRIDRLPDPDQSGTTAGDHPAEKNVINMGRVEVMGVPGTIECPDTGDTHCDDLIMTGPAGNGPGTWSATAIAEDDSGDPLLSYAFEFDDGENTPITIVSTQNTVEVNLGDGNWIASVKIDDTPSCPDEANDDTCTINFTVNPCPTDGDTFCDDLLLISQPELGGPGLYAFRAFGQDTGLDFPLFYTFKADDGLGAPVVIGPQESNEATFNLGQGTWEVSVLVDDLLVCPDEDPDATCFFTEFTIGASLNVALFKPMFQSSDCCFGLEHAVDGLTTSTMHTNDQQDINQFADLQPAAAGTVLCSPFLGLSPSIGAGDAYPNLTCPHALWIDLQGTFEISLVRLWNRNIGGNDECCQWRHRDLVVIIYPAGTLEADGNFNGNDPLFVSPLLNPENEMVGSTADGPPVITLDIYSLNNDTPISGGVIHVVRLPDLDFSGTMATPGTLHIADATIMQISEVEVFENKDLAECGNSGDTHCSPNGLVVNTAPPNDGPGNYEVEVVDADDDSDDPILYTFKAEADGTDTVVSGPQLEPFANLVLGRGEWTVSATVDDDILCRNVANDATCSIQISVTTDFCPNPGDAEHSDTVCEEMTVTRLGPGRPELPGEFRVELLADDDTGSDPLYYNFRAVNEETGLPLVDQSDPGVNSTTFALGPGTWNIRGTVNDFPVCLTDTVGPDGETAGVCMQQITLIGGENVAPQGVATHSSTCCGTDADRAIDGSPTRLGGMQHTSDIQDPDLEQDDQIFPNTLCIPFMGIPCMHWWQVEFDAPKRIELVSLFNRDGCCGDRLRDIVIQFISSTDKGLGTNETVVFESEILNPENSLATVVDDTVEPPILRHIESLTLDLVSANGSAVDADIVRLFRIPDPDFSGQDPRSGSAGHIAEARVLQMQEVRIFESAVDREICDDTIDNDEDGDTDCDDADCAGVAPCAELICNDAVDNDGDGDTDCDDADCAADASCTGTPFRRGDHDGSGIVDITDPLNLLGFLFLGQTPPICEDASDGDNSAALDISDALNVLGFLFLGSFPLNETLPGPSNCGPDPTEEIDPDGPGGFPPQPGTSIGCEQYPSAVGTPCP